MGAIQGNILGLVGTTAAAVVSASKAMEPKEDKKETGIDAKMAAKARKIAQQKINAIYQNQALSSKAKTRRMGVVMDEYNRILGGEK